VLTPSALSTVGLRRAIESRLVRVWNRTGVDIQISSNAKNYLFDSSIICDGASATLDIGKVREGEASLALRLAPSSSGLVGDREPIYNLPVNAVKDKAPIFVLRPHGFYDAMTQKAADIFDGYDGNRRSPETTCTNGTFGDAMAYTAEPVVEWCMENQRLRPSVIDVYSLDKGRDLLSNVLWSPDDTVIDEANTYAVGDRNEGSQMLVNRQDINKDSLRPKIRTKSNWVKPYLNNDSPEW
jgi:hypothetical protein